MRETIFITEADKRVFPAVKRESNASLELAPMIYTLGVDPDRGIFFKPADNFGMPKKIYGSVNNDIDRYFRSYELNDKNVGVALIGVKGSGKTITLKQVSNRAIELGYPVILINSTMTGPGLVEFLASIKQQCVVCFDEVDKTYTEERDDGSTSQRAQTTLVQLLDGAIPSTKKMFILTLNDVTKMNDLLFGRPSRIRYVKYYSNLEVDVVVDYLRENLKDCTEENIRDFVHFCRSYETIGSTAADGITFDVMAEYVREMNQFNESLPETVKMMSGKLKTRNAWLAATVFEEGKAPYGSKSSVRTSYFRAGQFKSTIHVQLRSSAIPADPSAVVDGEEIDENKNPLFIPNEIKFQDADFHEFGSNFGEFSYKKDGIQVNFRYVTADEHTQAENDFRESEVKFRVENGEVIETEPDIRGLGFGDVGLFSAAMRQQRVQEKLQNSSLSGAIGHVPAPHAVLSMKHIGYNGGAPDLQPYNVADRYPDRSRYYANPRINNDGEGSNDESKKPY